jgi:hypothetical protein
VDLAETADPEDGLAYEAADVDGEEVAACEADREGHIDLAFY